MKTQQDLRQNRRESQPPFTQGEVSRPFILQMTFA
jgi:hypothetical protein